MKKKIAALLSITLIAACFTGCSEGTPQESSSAPAKEDSVQTDAVQEEETPINEQEILDSMIEDLEKELNGGLDSNDDSARLVDIEADQVLWESNDVKVVATGMTNDGFDGESIKVLIENNGTKNVIVYCDDICINDFVFMGDLAANVPAGKKCNDTIPLKRKHLSHYGIESIGSIDVRLKIAEEETYSTLDSSGNIPINIISNAQVEAPEISGSPVFEQDGFKVWCLGYGKDVYDNNAINFYAENSTDKDVAVMIDNFSANGFVINASDSQYVFSGKKAFFDMEILKSYLEENSITDITDIQFKVNVVNISDDDYGTICESDYIDVKF